MCEIYFFIVIISRVNEKRSFWRRPKKEKKEVQYQNITPCVDDGRETVDSVYHSFTLTSVGDSVDWVLMLMFVSISMLWRLFVTPATTTQLSSSSSTSSSSSSSALQMSSRLMALELLLSTAFDLFIDLQRFAAVDSWMRLVWLALCPTLFFVLLPKTVKGWLWWFGCCCCCCVVGPFQFDFSPNDDDKFLWLWLSYNFDFVDSLPLCFSAEWTFNFAEWLEIGSRSFCFCGRRLCLVFWSSSRAFCDDNDEANFLRLLSISLSPLGHMVESKTSIEFVMAWSHRQQSRNSSIVTTPSWFLSIFYVSYQKKRRTKER